MVERMMVDGGPTGRHQRDGLISLTAAAERLGVSVKTVRRYITYGLLDGYRVGPKAIRVDAEAVARLAHRLPDGGETG